MGNRFFIAVDGGTAEQCNALTYYLKGRGYHWWHWLEDVWLLADVPPDVTPRTLWEELNSLPALADTRVLVARADGAATYYGVLPKDAHAWMLLYWGVPG